MKIEKIGLNDLTSDMDIMIYTDGACKGNPGPGGWAFAVFATIHETNQRWLVHEEVGSDTWTTSIAMELRAGLEALKFVKQHHLTDLTIVTDSEYLRNGVTEWVKKWKMKGWKTSNRTPVKHRETWEKIDRLYEQVKRNGSVTWAWAKGHSKNICNDYVDDLASSAAFDAKKGVV